MRLIVNLSTNLEDPQIAFRSAGLFRCLDNNCAAQYNCDEMENGAAKCSALVLETFSE